MNQLPNIEESNETTGRYAVSRDGYAFKVDDDRWRLNKDVEVSLMLVAATLPEPIQSGFRAALQRYAEEMSAKHVHNMATRLDRYLRDTGAKAVTTSDLLNWRAMLGRDREWYLGGLKGFLLAWHGYGFSGVSDDVADLLKELRLTGNEKGAAVASGDPKSGPMTDMEVLGLLDWLNAALVHEAIEFADYAYILTLAMTARRPVQIAALRGKDLIVEQRADGVAYHLNVPRAKQRGRGFREVFHSIAIIDDLYQVLSHQHANSVKGFEVQAGQPINDELKGEVPIFPNAKVLHEVTDAQELRDLLMGDRPDSLHETTSRLATRLSKINQVCKVRSERTGEPMHIAARRFRYTFATNMRRQGFGPFLIAEALDQSDIQNVRVYTENTAQEAVVINEVVGPRLAPFAQACMGKLVRSERDAIRGDDPNSRVPNDAMHAVGTCGHFGFCAGGWRACYTCPLFQPWVDGPHREVLQQLYAEKDQADAARCAEQVVNAQDRLILAVEHCVALCETAKREGAALPHGAS